MSLAGTLSTYLLLQLLIGIGFAITYASAQVKWLDARLQLRLNTFSLLLIFSLVLVSPIIKSNDVFEAPVKIWSSEPSANFDTSFAKSNGQGFIDFSTSKTQTSLNAWSVSLALFCLLALLITFGITKLFVDLNVLWKIQRDSFLIRKIGRVSVFAHLNVTSPFSYWLPSGARIIVPTAVISNHDDYRISLAHELQHHRNRDTLWVYALVFMRVLCFANPFAHLWSQRILELQEFACDETLVDRKKVQARKYASCLVETAQTALNAAKLPACATGFIARDEGQLLKRRIVRMLSFKKTEDGRKQKWVTVSVLSLLVTTLTATAIAAGGLVQDRRVSMTEAQAWAANAKKGSEFPIEANELVLKQLNRFLGTQEGRERMRLGLSRMQTYQQILNQKLQEYDAPAELLAIPLVESGYINAPEGTSQVKAAGLWQFIRSTARNYGMRVDDKVDERLDVVKETDAAMRYLGSNKARFKHWLLSVMAFNMGETHLQRGIDETGSRDPWHLVRSEYENDRDYLAKVMAAILIMKNPSSVE